MCGLEGMGYESVYIGLRVRVYGTGLNKQHDGESTGRYNRKRDIVWDSVVGRILSIGLDDWNRVLE